MIVRAKEFGAQGTSDYPPSAGRCHRWEESGFCYSRRESNCRKLRRRRSESGAGKGHRVYSWAFASNGHRAHVASEPGFDNQRDVYRQKKHQPDREQEMNTPRRLEASPHFQQPRVRRRNGRGHREPGDHSAGERNEDHAKVGALLQRAVRGSDRCTSDPEGHVLHHVGPEDARTHLHSTRKQMAPKMPGENPGQQVDGPREDQAPPRQEVQAPAPAVLVERPEGASRRNRRVHLVEERLPSFPTPMTVVLADRQFDPGRGEAVADFAPIEPRMHHEDFGPGEYQQKKANRHHPVGTFNPTGMRRSGRSGVFWRHGRARIPGSTKPDCNALSAALSGGTRKMR